MDLIGTISIKNIHVSSVLICMEATQLYALALGCLYCLFIVIRPLYSFVIWAFAWITFFVKDTALTFRC
jgi:hypothetical protein